MYQFKELLQHVLSRGTRKADRTGVGTISTFGYMSRFDLNVGFPIETTKKTAFKAAVTELIWMIGSWMKLPEYEGIQRTNIKFLLDNNVKIWTEWPYKAFRQYMDAIPVNKLEDEIGVVWDDELGRVRVATQPEFEFFIRSNIDFAIRFGDLGPVYQKQWRDFEGKRKAVDQLQDMISTLKKNPDSRRILSSYWNPTELDEMLLPPCHLLHQVYSRPLKLNELARNAEEYAKTDPSAAGMEWLEIVKHYDLPQRALSLQMYQRSSDCFLGVPFDWVFYALLTHMLAMVTNHVVDEFIWVSGDTHVYINAIEAAEEVLKREPFPFPQLIIKNKRENIEDFVVSDFALDSYQYHPPIKVDVAV